MINILSICGIVMCVVVLSKVLEKNSKEYVLLISIGASAIILAYLGIQMTSALDFLDELFIILSDSQNIYSILLKSLGICIVTNLAVDICKDASEVALSSVVLMAGKISILLLSIPLLQELFYTVKKIVTEVY